MGLIRKTLGGLNTSYYIRHFIFGLVISIILFFLMKESKAQGSGAISFTILIVINTFLYPYSRFVYEKIMGFIMGDNIFFVNATFMLATKAITMLICWLASVFIAPIGLAYLYFYHTREEQKAN